MVIVRMFGLRFLIQTSVARVLGGCRTASLADSDYRAQTAFYRFQDLRELASCLRVGCLVGGMTYVFVQDCSFIRVCSSLLVL